MIGCVTALPLGTVNTTHQLCSIVNRVHCSFRYVTRYYYLSKELCSIVNRVHCSFRICPQESSNKNAQKQVGKLEMNGLWSWNRGLGAFFQETHKSQLNTLFPPFLFYVEILLEKNFPFFMLGDFLSLQIIIWGDFLWLLFLKFYLHLYHSLIETQ